MEDKLNFGANNLAFLEQIDESGVSTSGIVSVANDDKANVNITNLEVINDKADAESSIVVEDSEKVQIKADQEKYKAEIKQTMSGYAISMSDLVIKVFEASDRPVFLVQDDKVVYANKTALGILEMQNDDAIVSHSFWNFVEKNDWKPLAENIGAMLTEDKELNLRMKTAKGRIYRIKLHALYIDDDKHFSFVLIGDRKIKYNPGAGLYDAVTGLPNFYLFEDRVQIAVNNEKFKDLRQRKNMMAILSVSIDNINELKEVNMVDFVLKKLASKLVFRLKKTYTIARGLKFQFWFLINDFNNEHDLEVEIEKIKAIFDEPVAGNYMECSISTSLGYSIYPTNAKTANKLIELSLEAVKAAIRYKNLY